MKSHPERSVISLFLSLQSINGPALAVVQRNEAYGSSIQSILICLEHSFWLSQQDFNPSGAFIKAWNIYLKTHRAMIDQKLDEYLKSKDSHDWFTVKHCPSEEELDECREIVLNNLLPHPKISI
ncbi:hypothetical protein M413DRAFT_12330 [Hebeloma cylindrosporum]|uniref:Uncharacterized protein n=1 Tax=Hebeloma cylindrosporum TaxID=76867 RepID=A0A0C3C5V3_HEBCY|nr:hypothetical protein M413DRAFT_12330 [Hebeloma cylindrosporum h7]